MARPQGQQGTCRVLLRAQTVVPQAQSPPRGFLPLPGALAMPTSIGTRIAGHLPRSHSIVSSATLV